MKRCFAFLLTVFVALSLTAFAHAGTYPDKSIKIIVPFNPGGGGEQGARLLEKDFKEKVGQPLSFIYKPGGTGLIGMVELSRQKPDGYAIGIHSYPLLMLDIITGRAGYTLDSFDFISLLCLEEVYLAVRADSPVSSAKELIERAKSEPQDQPRHLRNHGPHAYPRPAPEGRRRAFQPCAHRRRGQGRSRAPWRAG